MSTDHTQQQPSDAQRQSKDLSLKSTAPPTDVPGYETQKFLGSGAFGEVWTGIDQNTGRRVAIKFYTHRGGVDWTLLSREVEKLAVLSADRYVVQLLDVGWDSDPPYYVMDYIENGSLEDLLKREGTLPLSDAVEMFEEVSVGLMHLHGKGVLHCDLKPANVLLDADTKPRLADFGQSRLSHELKPSLGTLFYMAPEQADLEAAPDSRWDVYALGALLFCMLTGKPPFRSDELTSKLDSEASLPERLSCYRKGIKSAPRPTRHRQVAGIDRALIDIIDRCLAVSPHDRFQSVQSVWEALKAREEAKVRVPLLLLGVVAPFVLLVIMVYFGLTGYQTAVKESNQAVSDRVQENNDTFAKSVARAIEADIPRYFQVVERESGRPEFHQVFDQVREKPVLEKLRVPRNRVAEVEPIRQDFLTDQDRLRLKDYFQERLDGYLDIASKYDEASKVNRAAGKPPLRFASIFVTDAYGTILAVAYDDEQSSNSEGINFSYRTYFHGGAEDLEKSTVPGSVDVIATTHLSTAFRSTTTKTYKIGVSTPIYANEVVSSDVGGANGSNGKKLLGVMVMTIHLRDFSPFRGTRDKDHFAVLVDSRTGIRESTILHHDLFAELDEKRRANKLTPDEEAEDYNNYTVNLEQFSEHRNDELFFYYDPFAKAQGGEAYLGKWIAAMEWVYLPKKAEVDNESDEQPGLAVIVQENYEGTTRPIQNLGRTLLWRTMAALVGFVIVVSVQWYFVIRLLGGLRQNPARYANDRQTTDSLHNMKTLTAPRATDKDRTG